MTDIYCPQSIKLSRFGLTFEHFFFFLYFQNLSNLKGSSFLIWTNPVQNWQDILLHEYAQIMVTPKFDLIFFPMDKYLWRMLFYQCHLTVMTGMEANGNSIRLETNVSQRTFGGNLDCPVKLSWWECLDPASALVEISVESAFELYRNHIANRLTYW